MTKISRKILRELISEVIKEGTMHYFPSRPKEDLMSAYVSDDNAYDDNVYDLENYREVPEELDDDFDDDFEDNLNLINQYTDTSELDELDDEFEDYLLGLESGKIKNFDEYD